MKAGISTYIAGFRAIFVYGRRARKKILEFFFLMGLTGGGGYVYDTKH